MSATRPRSWGRSLLRPSDDTLSATEKHQVQSYRFVSVLGAIPVPVVGLLASMGAPSTPLWGYLVLAGLFGGLLVGSYVSPCVRRHYVAGMWGAFAVSMAWFATVAALNEFADGYGASLLLEYALLIGLVWIGARSMRPIFWFGGYGLLVTGGALAASPVALPGALMWMGAMATVALVVGVIIRAYFVTRKELRERAAIEQALRNERDRLSTLFRSLPTPLVRCEVREEGTIITGVNPAFEETFGVDAEAARGQDIDSLLVPEGRQAEATAIDRRALEEGHQEWEVRRHARDGLRTFQLQVAGRTPAEDVPEVYAIYTDVTERRRRMQALQEAKEKAEEARREAEEASQMKTAFLANMSHEIRTPLTSIIGFAETIGGEVEALEAHVETHPDEIENLHRFAGLIEESGRHLLETLDGVLNLSKLEAEDVDLAAEPVNLGTQVRAVARELRPQAEASDVALSVDTDDAEARADESGVQIVARNLLSNAIKYTEAGGQVWIRAYEEPRPEGEVPVLEVEDTGIGMEPGAVEHLFEPFRQGAEKEMRELEGTGLGLAVVQRATAQMGGTIDVDTEKGEGTRVAIRLPRAEATANGPAGREAAAADESAEQRG